MPETEQSSLMPDTEAVLSPGQCLCLTSHGSDARARPAGLMPATRPHSSGRGAQARGRWLRLEGRRRGSIRHTRTCAEWMRLEGRRSRRGSIRRPSIRATEAPCSFKPRLQAASMPLSVGQLRRIRAVEASRRLNGKQHSVSLLLEHRTGDQRVEYPSYR